MNEIDEFIGQNWLHYKEWLREYECYENNDTEDSRFQYWIEYKDF